MSHFVVYSNILRYTVICCNQEFITGTLGCNILRYTVIYWYWYVVMYWLWCHLVELWVDQERVSLLSGVMELWGKGLQVLCCLRQLPLQWGQLCIPLLKLLWKKQLLLKIFPKKEMLKNPSKCKIRQKLTCFILTMVARSAPVWAALSCSSNWANLPWHSWSSDSFAERRDWEGEREKWQRGGDEKRQGVGTGEQEEGSILLKKKQIK